MQIQISTSIGVLLLLQTSNFNNQEIDETFINCYVGIAVSTSAVKTINWAGYQWSLRDASNSGPGKVFFLLLCISRDHPDIHFK